MQSKFDLRPAIIIRSGAYIKNTSNSSNGVVIAANTAKDYAIPASGIPSGYSCIGYFDAHYVMYAVVEGYDKVIFQRCTQDGYGSGSTEDKEVVTKITVRNIGSSPVYRSYRSQDNKYYEQLKADLIFLRNDLL